ncbi:MAG TPA: hypothetical protein VGL58_13810 [Caulobacteraceae bacterium]|jgi:hypothetical protein
MSSGFQHQETVRNLNLPRSAPQPQHGAKPDKDTLKREVARSFQPRTPSH